MGRRGPDHWNLLYNCVCHFLDFTRPLQVFHWPIVTVLVASCDFWDAAIPQTSAKHLILPFDDDDGYLEREIRPFRLSSTVELSLSLIWAVRPFSPSPTACLNLIQVIRQWTKRSRKRHLEDGDYNKFCTHISGIIQKRICIAFDSFGTNRSILSLDSNTPCHAFLPHS